MLVQRHKIALQNSTKIFQLLDDELDALKVTLPTCCSILFSNAFLYLFNPLSPYKTLKEMAAVVLFYN